jgi:hypothetical protein
MTVRPVRERLFEKVQMCEHGSACTECCWRWLARLKHGHGMIYLRSEGPRKKRRKVEIRADVLMWIIAYGTVPRRSKITHTCTDDACMNYHHIQPVGFQTNALRTAYQLEGLA